MTQDQIEAMKMADLIVVRAIKPRAAWADRGDVLKLQASWTKGGKEWTSPKRRHRSANWWMR